MSLAASAGASTSRAHSNPSTANASPANEPGAFCAFEPLAEPPAPLRLRRAAGFLLGLLLGLGVVAASLAPASWLEEVGRPAPAIQPSETTASLPRSAVLQPPASGISSIRPPAEGRPIATAEQLARPAYVRPKGEHGGSIGTAPRSGQRSVCVRMCDGFYFPVGYLNGPEDVADQEGLCQAACPSAPVKLFTVAPGVETIDQAVSREWQSYASLPTAFSYRQARPSAACTCRRGVAGRYLSPFRDFTLRPGDAVVVDGGARVFEGASRWPFRQSDFRDFRETANLSKRDIQKLDELLDVSRRERLLTAYGSEPPAPPLAEVRAPRGFEVVKPQAGFAVLSAPAGGIRLVESRAKLVVLR